jgi:hypothetical protein
MSEEHWMDRPEDHDFPAALSYLTLLMDPVAAGRLVEALKNSAATDTHKAKDILRAGGLPLLAKDNAHVKSDLTKVGEGKKLSPVLLIRGEPCVIADGYHRVCASYHVDENTDIPCFLAGGRI